MLKRYWLVICIDNRYGPKNVGVTAPSVSHAKSIAREELHKLGWQHISDDEIDRAEIVENINISELDQNHVVPNMGVVSRQGVWFPNCNS